MNGENIDKGQAFEKYVMNTMFPERYYSIVRKTPKHSELQERYIEECTAPDFTFRRRANNFVFNVEAKFRSIRNLNDKHWITFCSEQQFYRYKESDILTPTFIAMGVGENPSYPEILLFFPIRNIQQNSVFFPELLSYFWFYKNKRVFYRHIVELLENSTKNARNPVK